MKEFDLWMQQIDPNSISSRANGDSAFKLHFNQREYIVYSANRGRTRLVNEIEMPEEVLQELWRENWSDQ